MVWEGGNETFLGVSLIDLELLESNCMQYTYLATPALSLLKVTAVHLLVTPALSLLKVTAVVHFLVTPALSLLKVTAVLARSGVTRK